MSAPCYLCVVLYFVFISAGRQQKSSFLHRAGYALRCAVGAYLPKALSAEELEAELRAIIAEVGAVSAKDMGKVMGVATKRLAGRADGKPISAKVKELLG